MIYGCDTSIRVTENLIRASENYLNDKPAFWGRYFNGIAFDDEVEYHRRQESPILGRYEIPILPIARATADVGSSKSKGERIGREHAEDFIASFDLETRSDLSKGVYFFLDVEPGVSLSESYYVGWSSAVLKAGLKTPILPCVYMNSSDKRTAEAINDAVSNGAKCFGLWAASYIDNFKLVKEFKPNLKFDTDVPILIWQFIGDLMNQTFDFNAVNPDLDKDNFFSHLILPRV
jgi:hypothetical protein